MARRRREGPLGRGYYLTTRPWAGSYGTFLPEGRRGGLWFGCHGVTGSRVTWYGVGRSAGGHLEHLYEGLRGPGRGAVGVPGWSGGGVRDQRGHVQGAVGIGAGGGRDGPAERAAA